jgi:hypothetical protein
MIPVPIAWSDLEETMAGSKQWREVCDEVTALCDTLERIPEKCECGDAQAHLEGACRCCHGHVAESAGSSGQPRCGERIAQLRADLALLCEDFTKAAGPVREGAMGEQGMEVRRELLMAAGDLGKILTALEDLDRAVIGFRQSCSIADMKQVKRQSTSLLARCEKVDAELARGLIDGKEIEPTGEE